jgi:hypothetical protein
MYIASIPQIFYLTWLVCYSVLYYAVICGAAAKAFCQFATLIDIVKCQSVNFAKSTVLTFVGQREGQCWSNNGLNGFRTTEGDYNSGKS